MNDGTEHPAGCSEEFAELCALFTSGELTGKESEKLRDHIAICDACATLLREYKSLAHVGMVKLADELEYEGKLPAQYCEKRAERRFIATLYSAQPKRRPDVNPRVHWPDLAVFGEWNSRFTPVTVLGTVIVVLLSIGVAFDLGRRTGTRSHNAMTVAAALPLSTQPAASNVENAKLHERLAAAQKFVDKMTEQSADAEKRISELSIVRASLVEEIEDLKNKDQTATESLVAVTVQRDDLQQQLREASNSLMQVKQDLSHAEQDRQGALLRVTSLETEINELHAAVSKANSSSASIEEFLAEDRDIRELMGARQLYIADVFDVQHDGRRSKPFGRVFYTKGRSLVFYAFDLQSQPGYHEAKAFQAWGKPDSTSAKPINLGIFYLDSEKNRRWVLKADNQDVLAQINAVFVTIEPHGGSEKPTGKPFLEAYLHSLSPNHP